MLKMLMTTCLIGTILIANSIDATSTNETQNSEPEAKYISTSQNTPNNVVQEMPVYPEYPPTKNGNFNDNSNNNDNKNDINDKASNYSVVPLYADDADETWQSKLKKVLVPLKNNALTFVAHFFDIAMKTLYITVVGLLTSSVVCALTPLCTLQFNGIGGTSGVVEKVQQMARSFMPNTEKINELEKNVDAAQIMNSPIPEALPAARARRHSPYWMQEMEKF